MESIYTVIQPVYIHLNTVVDSSRLTYENGVLTGTFTLPFSLEDLNKEIERVRDIRDPEVGDQPQYSIDAVKYLEELKAKLPTWQ